MKKELIKKRFSKSLNTYQENAIVQKLMAEKLVSLLKQKNFNNILELGCGTGLLTNVLKNSVNYKSYTALDIVAECEPFIKNIDSSITFVNCDIEHINPDKKYDLIISNAAFQWLDNFEEFVLKIKENLATNGCFLFTTFGQKNFQEITKLTNISLNYYSIDSLKEILSTYTIEHLEENSITQNFATIKEMFEHMKKTGVNAISEKIWSIKETKEFTNKYLETFENVHLTYNPIYVVLK